MKAVYNILIGGFDWCGRWQGSFFGEFCLVETGVRKATVKATTMCIVLLITQAHYAEIKLMFPELDVELKNLMAKRKAEIAAKQANPAAAAVSTDTSAAQSDTLQKDPPRLKRNLTVSSLFGAHRFDFLRSIRYQLQWRRPLL